MNSLVAVFAGCALVSGVAKQAEIDHRQMHIAWGQFYADPPVMSTTFFAALHTQYTHLRVPAPDGSIG
jgi:hypothetical protein